MSRFGWAYVNSLITGAVANGPTNSIQFNSGSQVLSGSSNFTFDPATNTLYLTGTLRADTLIVSSSQILKSGSTIFGDDVSDTHQFTGSIYNTTLVSGTNAQFINITSSNITASTIDISGISVMGGQVRAFGGIQSRNSPITVTNTNGTITHVSLTTDGLVSGTTGQFSVVTSSTITASNLFVSNDATIGANILGSGAFKGGYSTYTGSFTVPTTSYFVGISSTGSVITASLSNATSYPSGQTLIFKDIGGNAATNNIRVKPSGSQTIDGATSLVISSTSGSATIISNGVDGFYIIGLT